ncbi:MAG: hypothetical protein ACKVXR_12270 [Planctomycetota bacterium]
MFSIRPSMLVFASAVLAVSAWSQGARSDPPYDPVVGDLKPRAAEAGYAMCFGDESGAMCPTGNQGAPGHGCENSLGLGGGLLWAEGIARISQDNIVFQVANVPRRSTVFFLQATDSRNGGLGVPFGDGLMCMGGSVMKLGAVDPLGGHALFPSQDQVSCFASISALGRIPPYGGERYYQALYRDHNEFGTAAEINLTNAWAIQWIP